MEKLPLSDRQIEILQLVGQGKSNKEIAAELFISVNTVKVHLGNIFSKIGVASRTAATLYAIEQGSVKSPAGTNGEVEVLVPEPVPPPAPVPPRSGISAQILAGTGAVRAGGCRRAFVCSGIHPLVFSPYPHPQPGAFRADGTTLAGDGPNV
jgi:DNA-binding CsgD family transcriptional regulator